MKIEFFVYGFLFGSTITFAIWNFICFVKKERKLAKASATRDARKKEETLTRLGFN